jgi:vacuolar-type H+-ATPase subunit E/Vma4
MKKLLILAAVISLMTLMPLTTNKVHAQDAANVDVVLDETVTAADLGVSEPSSGFVGWLKNLGFNIQYGLTFNPVKKADMKLDHANQKLLEAEKYLTENSNDTQAQIKYEKALAKYEKTMTKVETLTDRFKDKSDTNERINQFMNRLTDNVMKHQTIIDKMKNNLAPERLQLIDKVNENTLKSFGEILKNIDTPERTPERIANAIENRTGSDFRYMKGMEFLNLLDENTRGDLKTVIQDSQERTTHRMFAAWENQDPEARTERFKEYMNGSSSDPLLQVESLNDIENYGLLPPYFKDALPAIKNDRIQRVENNINAFKNDEHRIKYLERVRLLEDPTSKTMLRNFEDKFNNPEVPGLPTRPDRIEYNIRSDIQNQNNADDGINQVQHDKDLRDNYKDRQQSGSNDTE